MTLDRSAIDLRSDTVTRPTPEMRRAIAEAEVGDSVLGDDPTETELEASVADLLGKEAALFFPSGTMANQTAILLLSRPGTSVLVEAGAHVVHYEEAGAAAWGGVHLETIQPRGAELHSDDFLEAYGSMSRHLPEISLVCLENTHNRGGGRVLSVEGMNEISSQAKQRGLPIHLDGARLPNAAIATGSPMSAWAELADTVMVSLSKGLGAPIGSVLAGTRKAMDSAWRIRRRLGGGMRQVGILASAGLYALCNNMTRLADDHRRAKRLAEVVSSIQGLTVVEPQTNIVMIDLDRSLGRAEPLVEQLTAQGVLMTAFGSQRLRAVTHLDVDDEGIDRAARGVREVVRR
ncbi:MAG: aminotransferase class I/II-fold pyridoxal phosphate-dependent enzyme [Gemmatimonas sp.]|nr:aminotransferase class I/II-fold pyridoxal phosphate-dependent enzyme [Gemmatimonas sp.]